MSKIENILAVNKKIIEINFTNSESLNIMKDDKASHYLTKLSECYEKFPEDDAQFFGCIIKSMCPEQTSSFVKCQKENKNKLEVCAPILMHIGDCMKSYSNRTLEILRKTKTN